MKPGTQTLRGFQGTFVCAVLWLSATVLFAQHKPSSQECLSCHSDSALSMEENGHTVSLHVDEKKLEHSIHGTLSCVDCHTDVKSAVHEQKPKKILCADCHAEAQQALTHSVHNSRGPGCVDCHGGPHGITAADNPQSPVSRNAISATCGRCHGQKFLMAANGQNAQMYATWQESVHGRAGKNGSAAVCTDCHGSHEILAANEARSPISRFNVPQTCGKCHAEVAATYRQSIHGQAIARGNGMAPVCTDCHGIHSIQMHNDPNAPVSARNLAQSTCARCHEGVRLTREFGVAGNRVSSYLDSYHGLASEGGSAMVANCASCHGVHNILPSNDPRSTIYRGNLGKTCGQCHPGVTQKFTETKVHIGGTASQDAGSIATRWVRWIYLPLIILVIGAMFVHNVILWVAKTIRLRRQQGAQQLRMSRLQRGQHLVLLISFIVLVLTGFALRFPNSWLATALGGGSEFWRALLHRIAGVALIGAAFFHVLYLLSTREGRKLFHDLLPTWKDFSDPIKNILYYLGLRKEKTAFGRFSYAEKAEYWALVWGTALMALTGVMLWARVLVGNLLARWWIDLATSVHFYEAVLATLAIVVWHFYQVIFDPDVYPMNNAWLDGKMPEDLYRKEHALEEKPAEKETEEEE